MKSKQMKTLALAICITASAGVFAQSKEDQTTIQQENKAVVNLDVNKDSSISKSEAKGSALEQRLLANWSAIDTNSDGLLSFTELKAFRRAQAEKR
jgi:hypothetical protein